MANILLYIRTTSYLSIHLSVNNLNVVSISYEHLFLKDMVIWVIWEKSSLRLKSKLFTQPKRFYVKGPCLLPWLYGWMDLSTGKSGGEDQWRWVPRKRRGVMVMESGGDPTVTWGSVLSRKSIRVPRPGTKSLLCSVPLRPEAMWAPEALWASSVTWGDADLGRLRMWLSDIASFPAQGQKCSRWPFPPSPFSAKSSGPLSTLQNRDEVDRWGVLESWAQGCLALLHASLWCG